MRAPFLFLLLLVTPLAGCQSFGTSPALEMEATATETLSVSEAKAQFHAGNYGLAEELFRASCERDPTDLQAWLGLAASYDLLRRFDLADRAYAQVDKLGGRNAVLLNNRGYSYLLRGDFAKARADLGAAQKLDPGNADIETNLAAALKGQRI